MEQIEDEKLNRGLIYPIVLLLWPIGVVATLMGFVIVLRHGLIYETCLQAFILLMMIYIWPKKEDD